jgi:hypothetical protein
MIEICGCRLWLFRGAENWDEFGGTGTPVREALMEGLAKHPERQTEILREFLSLNPNDQQAKLHFARTYRTEVKDVAVEAGKE